MLEPAPFLRFCRGYILKIPAVTGKLVVLSN